jgi:hypothetical protein
MTKEQPDYIYSHDGEYWGSGDYECALEQLVEAIDIDEIELGTTSIQRGIRRAYNPSEFIDADSIIDTMKERAYEVAGEHSEDFLSEVTKEQIKEFDKVLGEWLDHRFNCRFYTVEKVDDYFLNEDEIQDLKRMYE